MKSRILSVFLLIWVGLLLHHSSPANGKGQHEKPHGHGHWSAPPEAAKRVNPIPRNKASMERGKKLYQTHCAVCHGPDGKGDGPAAAGLSPRPTNLVQMAGHHSDGDFAWKIANGRGAMPAWKGVLSENDIWDLTNFIQSFGKQPHSHE
jgi:mono/diheme cytochrome c family protein